MSLLHYIFVLLHLQKKNFNTLIIIMCVWLDWKSLVVLANVYVKPNVRKKILKKFKKLDVSFTREVPKVI